ncbi:hypothetical protein TraAM80_08309 [Trypanosoma rangeli]|uniref:Uncharacterized protein n=1 Tax=Trypanosoma rangeli TaxID=5698 RepID=A0A3R7KQK4_TRYRA|nr:uncharacterized protein TraAM80_08309 [Trypanosoma rangeli]RNE99420.1 hypothetical protein TraAM80_08309 [Trypanosoma rangeli]|eukprot:RNE99420.1 hypothetical protein TraAM80_08309 [Trypanosoma rangeli]
MKQGDVGWSDKPERTRRGCCQLTTGSGASADGQATCKEDHQSNSTCLQRRLKKLHPALTRGEQVKSEATVQYGSDLAATERSTERLRRLRGHAVCMVRSAFALAPTTLRCTFMARRLRLRRLWGCTLCRRERNAWSRTTERANSTSSGVCCNCDGGYTGGVSDLYPTLYDA